ASPLRHDERHRITMASANNEITRKTMKFDPDRHHRRSIRLRGYDYTRAGAYFVTICTYQRACILGAIEDSVMALSPYVRIVEQWWRSLAHQCLYVELDGFVIMPNHVHGIIVITDHHRSTSDALAQRSATSSRQGRDPAAPSTLPNGTRSGSLNAMVQN